MKLVAALAVLFVLLMPTGAALACSVCANPGMAATAPSETDSTAKRVRSSAGAELLFGAAAAGDTRVVDRRAALELGVSPLPELSLTLTLPTLFRTIEKHERPVEQRSVLGDFELSAQGTLWASTAPLRQSLFLSGGVKAPTAPHERDVDGESLSGVLQPGCNSVTPSLGVGYTVGRGVLTFETAASLYLPIPVRSAPHTGESFRTRVALALVPAHWISTRFGFAARAEPTGELSPGTADPDSGGFVGSITQDVTVTPVPDVGISLGVYLPVVKALHGEQRLGTTWRAALVTSF